MEFKSNLVKQKLENIGISDDLIKNLIRVDGINGFFRFLYFEKNVKDLDSLIKIRDYLYQAEILEIKNKGRYILEGSKFNIEKYFEELQRIESLRATEGFINAGNSGTFNAGFTLG
ncbi:MAG: hypothetical protein WC356_05470 [Candidatus Micrarchaeia archaeon]|jgi:hypothetical protein